jgi:steroid delta-isomerase-like uncharacterized protein
VTLERHGPEQLAGFDPSVSAGRWIAAKAVSDSVGEVGELVMGFGEPGTQAPGTRSNRKDAMSPEPNKDVVRRYYEEVHNGRNYDRFNELEAPDFVEHDPLPGQGTGREGMKDRERMLAANLDVRFTIEDMISQGDKVVVRWRNHGTHIGEFLGIPATGREFSIAGINIYRLQDGRLAEGWSVVDVFGQMLQLGVIPAPTPAHT